MAYSGQDQFRPEMNVGIDIRTEGVGKVQGATQEILTQLQKFHAVQQEIRERMTQKNDQLMGPEPEPEIADNVRGPTESLLHHVQVVMDQMNRTQVEIVHEVQRMERL